MIIKPITDNEVWQSFVDLCSVNSFLHSTAWANFNQSQGYTVWKLGMYDNQNLVSIALVLKIQAKRGKFLMVPHGPLIYLRVGEDYERESEIDEDILKEWTVYLKTLAKDQGCDFIRIQPIVDESIEHQEVFTKVGYRSAPIHMHTELTTVLDITGSQDEVLLGMRKTTRQMIKKAERLVSEGLVQVESPKNITEEMFEVYKSTTKRGHFVPYSQAYLNAEWESFSTLDQARMFVIRFEGQILSWGMVLISSGRAFYHQGANILHKKVPASYLCQWLGISWAREMGCKSYDFWGVAPKDKPNHPWANISLFKRGFGGEDVEHLHAQDYVMGWKYWLNWLIESYRARKRGFKG